MTAPDLDVDLSTEREHLAASRAALRRMREHAQALYASGDGVAGDAWGAETLGRTLARRIAELADDPNTPLFFGRLDFGATAEEHAAHRYHIGRRHVTDAAGEPMVIDWRAPISRAFYRASAGDPQASGSGAGSASTEANSPASRTSTWTAERSWAPRAGS
jgi:DNA helicase IV